MRRRAFSLMETILATALMCGVMLLLFNLYPTSAMAVRNCQDQLQASSIAQSLLEELSVEPYSILDTGNTTRDPVVRGGLSYKPTVEIFDVGGDPTLLKGVRVTVSYDSVKGPRSLVHEMYVVNLQK